MLVGKTGRVEGEPSVGHTSEAEATMPCPDVPRTGSYCSAPALENSCRVEEIPSRVMGYYVVLALLNRLMSYAKS